MSLQGLRELHPAPPPPIRAQGGGSGLVISVAVLVIAGALLMIGGREADATTVWQEWREDRLRGATDADLWRVQPSGRWSTYTPTRLGFTARETRRETGLKWPDELGCVRLQGRVLVGRTPSAWSEPVNVPKGCAWEAPSVVVEPPGWALAAAGVAFLAAAALTRRRT